MVVAAAFAQPRSDSKSRRAAANAAHANGPDPEPSPLPPPNQAKRLPLKPDTAPAVAADRGDAVITGATAAEATNTAVGIDDAEPPPSASTGATPAAGAEDVRSGDAVSEVLPTGLGSSLVLPAPADTTELARGPRSGAVAAPAVPGLPGRDADPSPGEFCSADLLAGTDVESGAEEPDTLEPDPRRLESVDGLPSEGPPRAPDRGDREGEDVEGPDDDASAEFDPVAPNDPVVSANANGTDEIADPTPRATASAPTRPT